VDGALPLVRIDPLRMNQAVDNLVTNAIKFSEPGTKIEIECMRKMMSWASQCGTKGRALRRQNLSI
jgi:signal transduction histidine kinase